MGPMANHSPNKESRNSIFYLMTLDTEKFSDELLKQIPVAYARPPITFGSKYIYAMALVSTRDIENEMVLTDYNFDPIFTAHPDWYSELEPTVKDRNLKNKIKSMIDKTWEAGASGF